MWTIYYSLFNTPICGHSGYFLYFTITDTITVNNLANMNLHVWVCMIHENFLGVKMLG